MLGAIAGDMIGSAYEFHPWRGNPEDMPLFTQRSRFTDDTVMTVAVAAALMSDYDTPEQLRENLIDSAHHWGLLYPRAGYGGKFASWLRSRCRDPYNSWGNGSAMRVSPVGWAFDDLDEVERVAKITAEITHNHEEGIKGACATAGAVWLARNGRSKDEIRDYVASRYGYDMDRTLAEIQPTYFFEISCQKSVPEAILAFLESDSYEDAVRKAVWLGGDADTQAAIAGGIAEAFYGGIPPIIARDVWERLPEDIRQVVDRWGEWLQN